MGKWDKAPTGFAPSVCANCGKTFEKGDGWWQRPDELSEHNDCSQPKLQVALKTKPGGERYGDKNTPGLRILAYLGPKDTKSPGLIRHTFVVGGIGTKGTAFLSFNLKDKWLTDSYAALAMDMPEIVADDELKDVQEELLQECAERALENGVPEDQLEAEQDKLYKNTLLQIRIAIGGIIFQLQDWKGVERDVELNLSSLTGVKFSGVCIPSNIGAGTDVKYILECKREDKDETEDETNPPF